MRELIYMIVDLIQKQNYVCLIHRSELQQYSHLYFYTTKKIQK